MQIFDPSFNTHHGPLTWKLGSQTSVFELAENKKGRFLCPMLDQVRDALDEVFKRLNDFYRENPDYKEKGVFKAIDETMDPSHISLLNQLFISKERLLLKAVLLRKELGNIYPIEDFRRGDHINYTEIAEQLNMKGGSQGEPYYKKIYSFVEKINAVSEAIDKLIEW